MRQALFAVLLVAASFAGGAVVNGPGLRWAREFLAQRLHGDEEDSETSSTTEPGDSSSTEIQAGATIPASPIPPLSIEPSERHRGPEPSPARPQTRKGDEASAASMTTPRSEEPTPTPATTKSTAEPVGLPLLATTEVPPLEQPDSAANPWHSADSADSAAANSNSNSKPKPKSKSSGMADAAVALASLAGKALKRNEPRESAGAIAAASPAPNEPIAAKDAPEGAPDDWNAIRRALKAEGVARYGVEGDPGGRVRFHCVIPLAGRGALGQYFEAEADDEMQAARAALRRVALWKATEGIDSTPAP